MRKMLLLLLAVAQPVLAESVLAESVPAQSPSAEKNPPRPVISEILRSEAARLPGFPGTIAAEVESVLAFQTAGRIASRAVELGDRVMAGDALATLDQISLADDVSTAEAALKAAEAQAALAQQTLDRAEQLARRGVSAKAQVETAVAGRDSSAAAVIAAKANLARAEDAARYGVLRAPSAGVVIAAPVDPGTMVAPGTPVLTLAVDETLEVVINLPPEVLTLLGPAPRFLIRPRSADATPVPGRLRLVEPVADSTTRRSAVHIRLEGKSALIRIGSLVEVDLSLPEAAVLSLPLVAIRQTEQGPQVWRIAAQSRQAESVPVSLGERIGDRIVVTGALNPGDEILVRGVNSITEGQTLGERTE